VEGVKFQMGWWYGLISSGLPGKLRNPVSRRYLCVKNNDLLSKPGFFA